MHQFDAHVTDVCFKVKTMGKGIPGRMGAERAKAQHSLGVGGPLSDLLEQNHEGQGEKRAMVVGASCQEARASSSVLDGAARSGRRAHNLN